MNNMLIIFITLTSLFVLSTIFLFYFLQKTKSTEKQKQEKFLETISHKLQNPLTIMRGEIDLFKTNPKRSDLLEYLDRQIVKMSECIVDEIEKFKQK